VKKLNLLPPELQKQHEVNVKKLLLRALILTGLLFLAAVIGLGQYQLLAMEKQLAQLEDQRQQLLPYQQNKQKLEQQVAEAERKLAEFKQAVPQSIKVAELLKQMSDITPADTWLTRIEITEHLFLNGYSLSVNSVGIFSYYLNQLPHLEHAVVEFAKEVEINGVTLVEFRVKADISL
jgi:type IV pilus assembly protein PilN